jgi:hypothetical protein
MEQYLLVRDRDGAILGELDSAESAIRMLDALGDLPLRGLSLVRLEDSPGAVVGTTSITAMRPAGFDQLLRVARRNTRPRPGGRSRTRET